MITYNLSSHNPEEEPILRNIDTMSQRIIALDNEILFYQDHMTAFNNVNEFFRVLHRMDDLTREENRLYNQISEEEQKLYVLREIQPENPSGSTKRESRDR
ncbi:hypothetical protein [Ktedonospora formicarum]|uniref:Uncharacterized protein n=1 Tax=Ktedonospora formicarum TaxID=2778364 RepID=A0A8J3MS85_9CHLR|nr:hypothetical protein [Ktedonospora formicarum]GHO46842.1 hypothetical protein KSX_50050 [Ktedonospora formicarum]